MEFSHLINGKLVSSEATLEVVNPATGEVFARCPCADKQQLDGAVDAARAAFAQWKGKSFAERAARYPRAADIS